MANEYIEVEDLKDTLNLDGLSFADPDIERAVTAASRGIDLYTRRRFWADSGATNARYYTPDNTRETPIDDLITLTSVEIDRSGDGSFSEAWTLNADFVAEPLNAAMDAVPWSLLRAHPRAGRGFPCYPRAVRVTGRFGWATIPDAIVDATTIIAAQLLRRKREAPSGAVTFDGEAVTKLARKDPDVAGLLDPYVNWAG